MNDNGPDNDNDSDFGIRDGEVAIDLPGAFDASLYFIGRIRTPWKSRLETPRQGRADGGGCARALQRHGRCG